MAVIAMNGGVPRYKLPPLQDEREFAAFVELLVNAGVRSYLEIGSMYGASLWKVATALPKGSRLVAIDPMTDNPNALHILKDCIGELNALGFDATFILGDSMEDRTIEHAKSLGPYDALFIDGNHSPKYVMADWLNYGPMARLVGFHDINWNSSWVSGKGKEHSPDENLMGAPKVWNNIKRGRRFKEFKFYPDNNYYGIGVLFR